MNQVEGSFSHLWRDSRAWVTDAGVTSDEEAKGGSNVCDGGSAPRDGLKRMLLLLGVKKFCVEPGCDDVRGRNRVGGIYMTCFICCMLTDFRSVFKSHCINAQEVRTEDMLLYCCDDEGPVVGFVSEGELDGFDAEGVQRPAQRGLEAALLRCDQVRSVGPGKERGVGAHIHGEVVVNRRFSMAICDAMTGTEAAKKGSLSTRFLTWNMGDCSAWLVPRTCGDTNTIQEGLKASS
ncbi:MAG: hypothetical protein AAGM46_28005 [Cyanobacteria bacterium J06582_2]